MISPRCILPLALLSLLGSANAAPQNSREPEQQWTELARLPRPRQEHSTVAIDENTIAVVGGVYPIYEGDLITGLETTDQVELYDIAGNTWRTVAPAPYRVNHPNVVVVDGRIYLLGGLVDAQVPPGPLIDWVASGESHVYDPATDAWTQLESMPSGTERGSAVMGVHGEMIYVAGGMTMLDTEYQDAVSTVTAFNTSSGEWQRLPATAANIPEGRQHGVGAVVGDTFFVIGGRWFEKQNLRGTVYTLDLTDQEAGWQTSQNQMPVPRGGLSGAVVGNGFYTFGGEANPNTESGVFEETEVFDIETQQWSQLDAMAVPRHGTSAVAVGNRIYIPGGGLQEDGKSVVRDGVEHLLQTTDHFDAYSV
jgi:N-acetylneuraminic acid mutarotase